jgi:uncharacterized protein (TIGR03083 family)
VDHFDAIATQRRALTDLCEGLTPDQQATPSLCDAWSVHGVLAHLVMTLTVPVRRVLVEVVRARGNFHRANVILTDRVAAQSWSELIALLRANAENRFTPPGLDSRAPLSDSYLHAQDMLIPLGIDPPGVLEQWPFILEFLTSSKARRGFVGRELPAVTLVATDVAWSAGSGPEVRGPASALGLSLVGRRARVTELSGPGADDLARWIGGPRP